MALKKYDYYDWAKYQWEFQRRSPKYKRLYEKHIKEHGIPSPNQPTAYPDPSLSFDEIINNIESADHGILGSFPAFLMIAPKSVSNDYESATKIKIEIDFERVNSIKSLKKYVSQIIDDAHLVMKKMKVLPKKKKISMVDFDIILRVGDLRREGKKNREIAEIINPRKFKENPESAIRLIAYYNQRYKELVNKGFLEISYP